MSTAVVAVGAVIALALRYRARAAQRLARLIVDAEPSMAECREWRAKVERGLDAAAHQGRWISRETWQAWLAAKPALAPEVRRLASREDEGHEARQLAGYLGHDLETLVAAANEQIRTDELSTRRAFFDTIEKQPLTTEQASAVVTFDNRVQVVAAAGSGKTSVMVARAAYSIVRGFIPPERILLLAFNKDAATELQARIDDRLAAAGIDSTGLKAATFHAFGMTVIGRATGRKQRLAAWLDSGQDVEMVSRIVDDLRDRSFDFRFKWDVYRLLFARMSDQPAGGEPDGYDIGFQQAGFRTFNGEIVKSQGERMVADFLFLNGVRYEYERPYSHDVADAMHAQYRPDFYYPDADLWHEHWALDSEGNPPSEFEGYASSMQWKKSLHNHHGTTLIETTWATIIDQSGFAPLAADLRAHGLTLDWNPDRPLPGVQPIKHEDLARLMRSFMTHVKSSSLTPHVLDHRLKQATGNVQRFRSRMFLDLYWEIHAEWERRLEADDSIDFEDMLVQAAEHLESDSVDVAYDLVLVDEFQDASHARARLTRALVDKPGRHLLAVGDDWQSINRFAGADLSVMTNFSAWFGKGPTLRLQTTFRSPQALCDASSSFVSANPRQIPKTVTSSQSHKGRLPSLVRVANASDIPDALSSILRDLAAGVRAGAVTPGPSGTVEVDVLGRYRFDRDLLPRTFPRELTVRFRTVHASKGLEADYVVLPNVSCGPFGFPSEIVDDPVLSLAMTAADPYPHAEERRLFYVAMTRARRRVTMIGVQGSESAFIAELLKKGQLEPTPQGNAEPPEPCPRCGHGLLVIRRRRTDGRAFSGCGRFPACTFTRSVRN